MAAGSKSAGVIAILAKRCHRHRTSPHCSSAFTASAPAPRRAAHSSAYEKNPDDQIPSTVVPDDVIKPASNIYWAPHPQTGIFGPPTQDAAAATAEHSVHADGGEASISEQKAWFRTGSIEDVEKPHLL